MTLADVMSTSGESRNRFLFALHHLDDIARLLTELAESRAIRPEANPDQGQLF